uniref:Transposase n=1 Tax=Haemonchus contortus TaxID=6289 RepID=A0A7I4Z6D0_HAECO
MPEISVSQKEKFRDERERRRLLTERKFPLWFDCSSAYTRRGSFIGLYD